MAKPQQIQYLDIKSVGDLVTAFDRPDLPSIYATETIGFRPAKEGMVGERDFGTKHRYANYPSTRKLYSNYHLYDKNTNTSYELVATIDGSNNIALWVLDSTFGPDAWNTYSSNNNWIHLSVSFGTTITAVSGVTIDIAAAISSDDQFNNWLVVNTDKTPDQVAWITDSTIANNRLTTLTNLGASGLNWAVNDNLTMYRQTGIYSNFTAGNGATPHIRWNDFEAQSAAFLYYGSASSADNYPTQRRPLRIQRYFTERKYFYTNASTSLVTLDDNWYVDSGGGGLIPAFEETGSTSSPKASTVDPSPGTGTTTIPGTSMGVTNGSPTVTGSGTTFLTDLTPGQYFYYQPATGILGSVRRILSIESDTSLTVEQNFNFTRSDLIGNRVTSNTTEVDDISGDNWLKIESYTAQEFNATYDQTIVTPGDPNSTKSGVKIYATAMCDEHTKESDPIWRGFFNSTVDAGSSSAEQFTDVALTLHINFAKMNKRISGFRFYWNAVDTDNQAYGNAPDASSDYKLVFDLDFHTFQSNVTWSNDTTEASGYTLKAILPDFKFSFINPLLQAGANSVKKNIGHEIDTSRSYMTPRFSINTSRGGGGVMVADQTDSILRMSNYNGDGVHEEDNFADVTLDNVNLRQKIFLQSRGELIGLGLSGNNLLAFKRTELESINLITNIQEIIPIDCVARRSIISTPDGTFWAGRAGTFFFPADGSGIRMINPLWKNLYDGTLRTDDGTNPRISDSNRTAMIAGYNPVYREVWFYLPTLDPDGTSRNLCYRYLLDYGQWRTREFNVGSNSTIQFFTTRKDNTFTVGYGHAIGTNGLLLYPTDTSSLFWEDDVTAADATASKGIPTKLVLNAGDLYGISPNAVIHNVQVDAEGDMKSSTTGYYTLNLYANNESAAFDTKTQLFDKPSVPRMVTPRGGLEKLRLALSLPTTNLSNFKNWDISNITVGFVTRARTGSR